LAKLAGGVAVIRVGGATEVEVKEKKDRVEDALNATRAAVEEGILPGGGVPLLRAIPALDTVKVENSDQKTGVGIVRKAIRAPARQIVDNSGADGAVVVGKLLEAKEYGYGYGYAAQTGEYGDLVALGIIDPTKVVCTALEDAASIAGLIVTTEATITEHPKKETPALLRRRHGRHGRHGLLRRTRSLRQNDDEALGRLSGRQTTTPANERGSSANN
jgi:chaperonin GroEL